MILTLCRMMRYLIIYMCSAPARQIGRLSSALSGPSTSRKHAIVVRVAKSDNRQSSKSSTTACRQHEQPKVCPQTFAVTRPLKCDPYFHRSAAFSTVFSLTVTPPKTLSGTHWRPHFPNLRDTVADTVETLRDTWAVMETKNSGRTLNINGHTPPKLSVTPSPKLAVPPPKLSVLTQIFLPLPSLPCPCSCHTPKLALTTKATHSSHNNSSNNWFHQAASQNAPSPASMLALVHRNSQKQQQQQLQQ